MEEIAIMSQVSTSIDASYVATRLKEWAAKVNRPAEELMKEYKAILEKTDGRTDAAKYKKALNTMLRSFNVNMKSSAVSYRVIIVGASAPSDMIRKYRQTLEKKYKNSPSECIADGSVRLDGKGGYELIDIRKTWKSGAENFGYGKPLPDHQWVTTLYAVAKKQNEDQKWIPATIALRDEQAVLPVQTFKEFETRFNGSYSSDQGRYLLNASKVATSFENVVRELSLPEVAELIDQAFQNKFVLPSKLLEDFQVTQKDPNRFIVTEATLNRHYTNPKDGGISSIELVDETLGVGETITGFVDSNIKHLLENVEDGKTVTVIAKTTMLDEKDEDRNPTGNQVLGMNVYSVFERPE